MFMIRAIYTDNSQEIGYWSNVQANGQDPSSYEHVIPNLPRAGPIQVQVWAHDVAGRESAIPGVANAEVHQGAHRWTLVVKDEGTSLPIQGATVILYPGDVEKTTDTNGECWFDVEAGYYQANVYKEGYRAEVVNKQIDKDEDTIVFLEQTAILWSLKVTVEDTDGNGIPYATIKVGAFSEAFLAP